MNFLYHFEIQHQTRQNLLNLINTHSVEEMNLIPEGFNNNLVWNLGHVIVTQQLLVYQMAGLKVHVTEALINQFRKGSKPEKVYEENEIEALKKLLIDLIDQTKSDFEIGIFQKYDPYTTSYGMTLSSAEEAIAFNNVHESMHLGVVMQLSRLVSSN